MRPGQIKELEQRLGESIASVPRGTGMLETSSGKRFFIKRGYKSRKYTCEANGLNELSKAEGVRLPRVILVGESYVITEYIETRTPTAGFFEALGRMVAAMHKVTSGSFGFYEDNFIGNNPQLNIPAGKPKDNWAEFYYRKRLMPQVELAGKNGYSAAFNHSRLRKLESAVYLLLDEIREPPSLLHGDLWAGNYLCGPGNTPYLIDPAAYYGHRETDIAMTLLFGVSPGSFTRNIINTFLYKPAGKRGYPYINCTMY